MRQQRFGLFGLLGGVVLAAALPASALQPDWELAQRLPEDTLLYWSTAPIGQIGTLYQESVFGKLWTKSEPLRSLPEVQQFFAQAEAELQKNLGVGTAELLNTFSGSVSVGLGDFDPEAVKGGGPLPFIARVGVGDLAVWARLEAKMHESLSKELGSPQVEDWEGSRVTVFAKPGKPPICSTLAGQTLYLATDRDLLRRALSGPDLKGLGRSKRFADAADAVGRDGEVFLYVDLKKVLAKVKASLLQESPQAAPKWEMFGLDALDTAAIGSGLRDGRMADRFSVRFHAPPSGVLGLLSGLEGGPIESLALVPQDATYVQSLNVDGFPRIFERVMDLVRKHGPPGAADQVSSALAMRGEALGIDLRSQLLDHLAGEASLYMKFPDIEPAAAQNPLLLLGALPNARAGLILEVTDSSGLDQTLSVLLAKGGIQAMDAEYKGKKLKVLTVPGSPVSPAYAFVGKWLVLGMNAASVEAAVDLAAAPGQGLDKSPALAPAAGLLAEGPQYLGLLDMRRFATLYAPFVIQALRKEHPDFDWSRVPPLAEIASVLQTDFGMMRFGPQQWKIHSASSLGAGVPQIGIVAAIAIPSLLRARMSANEASAAGSLKTLAAAQTDFNNNSQPHTFADSLQKLGSGEGAGDVRYIDEALASGFKSGYEITMVAGLPACSKEAPGSADAPNSDDPRAWDPAYIEDLKQKCEQAGGQLALYGWRAEAHPIEYRRTGIRSFFIDETGILLGGDNGGKPGTPDLPEL